MYHNNRPSKYIYIPSEEGIKYFDIAVFVFSFLDVITARVPKIRVVAISIPMSYGDTLFSARTAELVQVFVVRWTDKRERVSR